MRFARYKKPWLIAAVAALTSGCCEKELISKRTGELYSADAHTRSQAALNLARCGEDASQAVPRLAQLLYDSNVGVQSAAAYALNRINTPQAKAIMEQAEKRRGRGR